MKKLFLFLLFGLSILIYSCQKDDIASNSQIDSNTEVEERQRFYSGDFWDPCDLPTFTILVDTCFLNSARADVLTGIHAGIQNYNAVPNIGLNIDLFIGEMPVGEEPDVTMVCNDTLGLNGHAGGNTNHSGGAGGDLIQINAAPDPGSDCIINACYHTNTVMHELGHILGIAHTHEKSSNNLVPGTTAGGPSVFIAGDCNSTICDFSADDITTLEFLFPLCNCPPPIIGLNLLCERGEYCIEGEIDNIRWNFPPSIEGQNTRCIQLQEEQAGSYLIRATVEVNGCEYEISKTIQVDIRPKYPNISVLYDPCDFMVYVYDNANSADPEWGWEWTISASNSGTSFSNQNPSQAHISLNEGSEICVDRLTVKNRCGSMSTDGEPICFTIPTSVCIGDGQLVIGIPVDTPDSDSEEGGCINNFDCGLGFECIDGICVPTSPPGDECIDSGDCPPGTRCKEGNCVPI